LSPVPDEVVLQNLSVQSGIRRLEDILCLSSKSQRGLFIVTGGI
jgi:hypothetical protein